MKYINAILLTTLIISLLITGCNNTCDIFPLLYQNSIETSINNDVYTSKTNTKNKKQLEIDNLEKSYSVILDSEKSYSDMRENEMNTAKEIISNWNKLSLNFKSKYIKQKKNLEESIHLYESEEKMAYCSKKAEEIKNSYDTGITYEDITTNSPKYLNSKLTITGKIISPFGSNPENDMKIAVNNNEDEIIFIYYDPKIINLTFIKDENVIIRGYFVKTVSDLSIINGETKIPRIYANYIDIVK